MTEQKLVERMQEARVINAAENVILPLLELRIRQRMELACSMFRDGQRDFIADIAYITGLLDLIQELKSKQLKGENARKTIETREE